MQNRTVRPGLSKQGGHQRKKKKKKNRANEDTIAQFLPSLKYEIQIDFLSFASILVGRNKEKVSVLCVYFEFYVWEDPAVRTGRQKDFRSSTCFPARDKRTTRSDSVRRLISEQYANNRIELREIVFETHSGKIIFL